MNEKEIIKEILNIKEELGEKLVILTHHYQCKEIADTGHYRGDSFGLSRKAAADQKARFIVFCGVHFMAESAEILSRPHQIVQIPDKNAGCPMADMANIRQVESAWNDVTEIVKDQSIMPVVYMNSDADIKAFCGRHGGTVCTSSNAQTAFRWGLKQREKIFFFPDRHLGENTGHQMEIKPDRMIVWNPGKTLGGNNKQDIKNAEIILWDGYCNVHVRFRTDHVLKMRKKYPDAKIVVHPECKREVVESADASGSTSFIVKYVKNAPPGSTVIIGTEINLIHRLAMENPDKNVMDLHYSLCPNMFKINLEKLLWTLNNIGQTNVVSVPEKIKADARKALNQMLALPSEQDGAKRS